MKAVVAAEHTKANAVRQLQALGYRVILKKPRRGMNKDQTPPPVSDHPPGHQRLCSPAAVASAFPRNPERRAAWCLKSICPRKLVGASRKDARESGGFKRL
jgi:hypothetical protein